MALFFRAHILYTSMVRLKDISITLRFISSICTDQFNLQKQPGEGEHKLSRKSQKEHFIYQQDVLLQAHICFSTIFAAYVLSWSILSLNSCTILFWFCMHKTKIWTKARFFPDFFSYTAQDFREKTKEANNPILIWRVRVNEVVFHIPRTHI